MSLRWKEAIVAVLIFQAGWWLCYGTTKQLTVTIQDCVSQLPPR